MVIGEIMSGKKAFQSSGQMLVILLFIIASILLSTLYYLSSTQANETNYTPFTD